MLLGSGVRGRGVMKVSADVVRIVVGMNKCGIAGSVLDQGRSGQVINDLRRIHGLGKAKTAIVLSAIELGRRLFAVKGRKILTAQDVLPLVSFMADKQQEYLVCISLSGAREVLSCRVVTIGLLNSTSVHPREVFAEPLAERAESVVLVHNHPSGRTRPSRRDVRVTEKLVAAGELLGIRVRDHLIITSKNFFSFKNHGLLK